MFKYRKVALSDFCTKYGLSRIVIEHYIQRMKLMPEQPAIAAVKS
jgi:hypothetical protein